MGAADRSVSGFARWLTAERYAETTTAQYRHYASHAERWCIENGETLARARVPTLRAWWDSLSPGPTTRRTAHKSLTLFYQFIGRNVKGLDEAVPLVPQPRGKPRPIASDEHLAFIGAAHELGGVHEIVGVLFATTGCRFNELRRARRQQFDLHGAEWRIVGKGSRRSGPRARFFPLHSDVIPVVAAYFVEARTIDYLFPAEGPSTFPHIGERRFREIFRVILDQAGLPRTVVPHRLRHTFATEALGRGVDVRVLQELLGHDTLASTQIYTAVTPEQMRVAVDSGPS